MQHSECYELLYLQIFFETTTQQKSVSAQLWGITDYYVNQFIPLM